MAFQRKKPAAIGAKAPLSGLHSTGDAGSTKSNSTDTAFRSILGTRLKTCAQRETLPLAASPSLFHQDPVAQVIARH
jgi:hypothetical protein